MKILAIEKEVSGSDWNNKQEILTTEARHVYELYLQGYLREIYFTESHNAVLILECESRDNAVKLLNEFPLVKNNLIQFDVSELQPYTGLSRLIP